MTLTDVPGPAGMVRRADVPAQPATTATGDELSVPDPPDRPSAAPGVAAACGAVAGTIGVVELVAWHAQFTDLLQIRPGFAPVQYNTALALALSGLALAFTGRWRRTPVLLLVGLFDVVLGAATVAEHAFAWDLRIDTLLVDPYLVVPGSVPGRPAVNTALCLVVLGAGLIAAWWPPERGRLWALLTSAGVTASIAVVALFGYVADVPTAYGWFNAVAMALPTALAVLFMAGSLTAVGWSATGRSQGAVPEWAALLAGFAAFTTSVGIWLALVRLGHASPAERADAAPSAMLVSAALSGVLFAVATWLGQRSVRRRFEAEALAAQLSEEVRQRQAAETAARDSENLLFALLDTLPVGVFVADHDGRPRFTNQVAQDLLGQGVVETDIGRLAAVYHAVRSGADDPYPVEDLALTRALRGERCHLDDMEIVRPDRRLPIEVWGSPVRGSDGGIRYASTAFVDVSDRRRDERRLAQQATLLDLARDAIFVRDADHRIRYWNSGAESLYGWTAEEAQGQVSFDLLRTEIPESTEAIEATLATAGHWSGELVQHTRDGRRLVVLSRWAATTDASGAIDAVLVINSDVSDRRAVEAELRRKAEEIRQTNVELNRSNDELEQFAYVASHDLSEPLRAISGPISLLARRYQGQLDPDADQLIEFAVDGCQRMQTLINDLLAFSRVGRVESGSVPVDLNLTVAHARVVLAEVIAQAGASVEVGTLPTVEAEPTQMSQVFQNLLSNALKFRDADRGPRVTVTAEHGDGAWRFEVSDNGIGIEPRHRERVFGMFKRLHTRTAYPGTGIGLALCRKIIERHGGAIGVDDGLGGTGTTVWFTLPDRTKEDSDDR